MSNEEEAQRFITQLLLEGDDNFTVCHDYYYDQLAAIKAHTMKNQPNIDLTEHLLRGDVNLVVRNIQPESSLAVFYEHTLICVRCNCNTEEEFWIQTKEHGFTDIVIRARCVGYKPLDAHFSIGECCKEAFLHIHQIKVHIIDYAQRKGLY